MNPTAQKLTYAANLMVAFLIGLVPMWLTARERGVSGMGCGASCTSQLAD